MNVGVSAYLGVVGVMAATAAFSIAKLPRFHTDAFKALPEAAQARSIRRFRWLFGAGSVFAFAVLFGIGFLEGYLEARNGSSADRDLRQVASVYRDFDGRVRAADTRMITALEAFKLDEILAADKLVTAPGRIEARRQLSEIDKALRANRAELQSIQADIDARLATLGVSDEAMKALRQAHTQKVVPVLDRLYAARHEIAAAAGEIVELVEANARRVKSRDHTLVLADAAASSRLNALGGRIERASAAEDGARKEAAALQANYNKAQQQLSK